MGNPEYSGHFLKNAAVNALPRSEYKNSGIPKLDTTDSMNTRADVTAVMSGTARITGYELKESMNVNKATLFC